MKKKEKITLGVIALLLIVTIIGVSYAAFTFGQSGKNLNTMTTGIMQMSYEETSNVIKMTGALPTTDATGKVRLNEGEYFDFTVSSTIQGDAQINWEIAAEDFSSNTFDGKNIKLYLTSIDSSGKETEVMAPKVFTKKTTANKKTGRPANMMSLATGTMSASTSTKYRLRMWVDENYNPQGDGGGKKFAVRINVYGKLAEEVQGSKMKSFVFSNNTAYKNVTKVVTSDSITAPSNVTSSEDVSEAGDGSVMAYVGNNTLTIAGDGVIIAPKNSYMMFYGLSKVTSIDLSNFNTLKVKDMGYMFGNCTSLTSLDVSNFDTSNVTNMPVMFYHCYSLTSLDLANFDTSNVTNMQRMFSDCNSLTSLDLSNFDTSNVTNMSWMFYACKKITTLDLSNFDTSNVTNMTKMFTACNSLTGLDLSKFDTSKVVNMSYMFNYCDKLVNLNISNFNTSNVTNMISMFSNCSSLTSLDVSSFNTSNVTNMNFMFYSCSSLKSVNVSSFNTSNVTDMSFMFADCGGLTSLDVSNFDTSKVTKMSAMFYNCNSLTSLDLANFVTSNVTNMQSMFSESSKIQSIKVGSKWVIGSDCTTTDMFTRCGVSAVTYV